MVVVVAAVAKGELCRVLRVPVGRLGGRTGRASPVVPGGASLWGPHDWICIPSALQEPWLLFSQPLLTLQSCNTSPCSRWGKTEWGLFGSILPRWGSQARCHMPPLSL